jgi:hypothetical protein
VTKPTTANPITVSVLIATYNRSRYLPDALDSVLGQTRPPEEIIVADDGSTDNTAEVTARYGPRIQYHKRAQNQGRAAALNTILPLARGSHIWMFDDDDVALPDALQSHVDFLAAHPQIDFSYSTNYLYRGEGDIWQRDHWRPKNLPVYPVDEFFIRHALAMHAMLQGMLIPKRCFEQTGLFDPALHRSQDVEMVLRLAHRFRAGNLQKPTFVLRDHSGARGPKQHQHAASQRAEVWLKYGKQVYRKVRDTYPLSAYLPHPPGEETPVLNNQDQGCALLQRGSIMLRHGLMEEALADMKAGLGMLGRTGFDARRIKAMLTEAFNVDSSRLSQPCHFAFELKKFLNATHLHVLTPAIMRGTYWALNRAVRQRHGRDMLRSAGMLGVLLLPLKPGRRTRAVNAS